jgi:hypothetical protein
MTTRGDEEDLAGNDAIGDSGSRGDEEGFADAIGDAHLPEDLRPGDDNPLAEGLDPSETAGDLGPGELLHDGKKADQEPDDAGSDSGDDDA